MAKKVIVELIDDIDGTRIDDGEGEQVTFSVAGADYTIDLGTKNANEFHRQLDFYIEHATRVGGSRRRVTTKLTPEPQAAKNRARSPEQSRAIRDWANTNGYKVSARGRISAEVEQAFAEAH